MVKDAAASASKLLVARSPKEMNPVAIFGNDSRSPSLSRSLTLPITPLG